MKTLVLAVMCALSFTNCRAWSYDPVMSPGVVARAVGAGFDIYGTVSIERDMFAKRLAVGPISVAGLAACYGLQLCNKDRLANIIGSLSYLAIEGYAIGRLFQGRASPRVQKGSGAYMVSWIIRFGN